MDAVFTGKKEGEELGAHYRSADVFVFPSRTDTFGMVLVEALAKTLAEAGWQVSIRHRDLERATGDAPLGMGVSTT